MIQKSCVEKIPNTNVSLTKDVLKAINEHWQKLEELRNGAKTWKPKDETIKAV